MGGKPDGTGAGEFLFFFGTAIDPIRSCIQVYTCTVGILVQKKI